MGDGISVGELLLGLFGFLGGTSLVSGLLLRRFDRFEKKLDRREADRVEESIRREEVMLAMGRLCEANTSAVRILTGCGETCLPEQEAYREANQKFEHFLREKSAQYLHLR